MIKLSDVSGAPSRNVSSSRSQNVIRDVIDDHIVLVSPLFNFHGGLTCLPAIQAPVRQWITGNHPSEVPGVEGSVYVPGCDILDAFLADLDS